MESIIATLKSLRPRVSVACLQEVTPKMVDLIHKDVDLCHRFNLSCDHLGEDNGIGSYGVLTLVDKSLNCSFTIVPMPSDMDRQLVIAHCNSHSQGARDGDHTSIAVGNIHLESKDNHPTRERQLAACHAALGAYDTATCVLAGDFNFCSTRNYQASRVRGRQEESKEVLNNDSLATYLPGYVDVWLQLHTQDGQTQKQEEEKEGGNTRTIDITPSAPASPKATLGGRTVYSSPVMIAGNNSAGLLGTPETGVAENNTSGGSGGGGGAVEGYTYDSEWNGLVAYKHERMRYDRIMLRSAVLSEGGEESGGEWVASGMRLLGTEPIDAHLLLTTRGSGIDIVRGLWPSDHFGLSCVLNYRKSGREGKKHRKTIID